MNFRYDLHVHSVLSGCASRENTINNIMNMARLCKIDFLAITDHNSGLNSISARQLAEKNGIVLIPGTEVATSEDIHVLCYIPTFDKLLQFCNLIKSKLPNFPLNKKLFYSQTILDCQDRDIGEVENFLGVAADIGIYELSDIVKEFDGVMIPAHVNKDSNGIMSILGCVPTDLGIKAVEVTNNCETDKILELKKIFVIVNGSDSHSLGEIVANEHYIDLKEKTAESFFDFFKTTEDL